MACHGGLLHIQFSSYSQKRTNSMDESQVDDRYRQLQRHVGWTDDDEAAIRSMAPELEPAFDAIVEDFYAQIDNHPDLRR